MIYPQIHLHFPVMLFCPHLNHLQCTNSFCSNILLFQLQGNIPCLSCPLCGSFLTCSLSGFLLLRDLVHFTALAVIRLPQLSHGYRIPYFVCNISVLNIPTWTSHKYLKRNTSEVELLMLTSLSSLSKSVPPQLCKTSCLTCLHII